MNEWGGPWVCGISSVGKEKVYGGKDLLKSSEWNTERVREDASVAPVIKLLSKRCRIPNLLVEGGLSHERSPSVPLVPLVITSINFNVKFYTSAKMAKINNS